jgi:hypothetical protein
MESAENYKNSFNVDADVLKSLGSLLEKVV